MIRFRYGQIEKAIARVHGLPDDPETLKTFRGRVRNFQKLGLVPSAPGKGQKVSYELSDAVAWALCFELAEAGFPPSAIKQIVERTKKEVIRFFVGPTAPLPPDRDVYLVIQGHFLQWNFGSAQNEFSARIEFIDRLVKDGIPDRVYLINLSAMKRRLSDALASEVTIEEPSGEPGTIEPFSAF